MKIKILLVIALFLLTTFETIAQSAWEMWFMGGYTQHHAFMVLDGNGGGKVRVKFFSANTNRTEIVEQTIKLENTTQGIRLACYDAVYANTNYRHLSYATDNFYLIQDDYGNTSIYNADDGSNLTKVTIKEIKKKSEFNQLKIDFNWY